MPRWSLRSVQIAGGFLGGLKLELPPGLTCIIGPRGSGKSTFAEALRYALSGLPTSKTRRELMKANLASTVVTLSVASHTAGGTYELTRSFGERASIYGPDGQPIADVDVDRGTFLPLDAFSSSEIEAIADESLGVRRRDLLDELRADQRREIRKDIADAKRDLEANADLIKNVLAKIDDCTEEVEELGDVGTKLKELSEVQADQQQGQGPANDQQAQELAVEQASKQAAWNTNEIEQLEKRSNAVDALVADIRELVRKHAVVPGTGSVVHESANAAILERADGVFADVVERANRQLSDVAADLVLAGKALLEIREVLLRAHDKQRAEFGKLQAKHAEVTGAIKARLAAQRAVERRDELLREREAAKAHLAALRETRATLRARYVAECERLSALREEVARTLDENAGENVRVRVLRNADTLDYQQLLAEGLRGSGVRKHGDLVEALMRVRPEHLAQVLQDNDVEELSITSGIPGSRAKKVLDGLRANVDPYAVELMTTDDRISIELNVGGESGRDNYRDAAKLSRGQKCTALLPLLLARRDAPLLIDQPEDNLDNHFIYETVVDSIRRLREFRQMVFITHNANIPVLGDADMVVVMNSDGERGYVDKMGPLDECRDEIVDLLEGGREAFELRRKRYGRA